MEENKLKELWKEIHTDNSGEMPLNIKEIIHKRHCNVISRTLRRQKILIFLFAFFLIISVGAGTFNMIVMEKISISQWAANAFLLFLLVSGIGHYQLLTKSADLYSIKDSNEVLKKQLKRKINLDFMIYLIFFYGMTIRLIMMYLNNFDELSEMKYLFIPIAAILLTIPWLMRHQQNHRYRYYFNSLDKTRQQLEVSE